MPIDILEKIGENDVGRKNSFIAKCLTLQKQNLKWKDHFNTEESIDSDSVCSVFLYSSDKIKLNRILDDRVEQMILKPSFFEEIIDFAK